MPPRYSPDTSGTRPSYLEFASSRLIRAMHHFRQFSYIRQDLH